jgi:hypothetical protein
VIEMPDLRRAWFAFHDARSERRALEWLVEHDLVEPGATAEAIAARGDPDPDDLPGLIDAQGLAHRVAHDLRRVYRKRLRTVLLVGAWARRDAHPEAPVELVVVLDRFADRWAEKRRMGRILWRHSIRNDAVVTAAPVAQADFERAEAPPTAAAAVAAFTRRVVVRGGLDLEHGAVLRRLFDDRGEVERALADAPAPVADAAIADAARLVDAARAWADARRPGALPAAAISAR